MLNFRPKHWWMWMLRLCKLTSELWSSSCSHVKNQSVAQRWVLGDLRCDGTTKVTLHVVATSLPPMPWIQPVPFLCVGNRLDDKIMSVSHDFTFVWFVFNIQFSIDLNQTLLPLFQSWFFFFCSIPGFWILFQAQSCLLARLWFEALMLKRLKTCIVYS